MLGLKQRSELTAINIINAVLAVFLFFSPWLVGYRDVQIATWNAGVCGLVIALVAALAITRLQEWEEWSNALLGLGRLQRRGSWALPALLRPCGPTCWWALWCWCLRRLRSG
jgi:hypothetical protein